MALPVAIVSACLCIAAGALANAGAPLSVIIIGALLACACSITAAGIWVDGD